MEYHRMVKSALKSCVLRDTAPFIQSQNQLVSDNGFGADDVFPVDDLLIDFSNEGGEGDGEGSFQEEKEDLGSVSLYDGDDDEGGGVFDDDDGTSHLFSFSSQLAVPDDDLAELEWVSHYVHDSLPELPVLYPIKPSNLEPGSLNRSEPVLVEHPRFPAHVPVKARSKRPRIARREHPSPSDSSSSSGNSSSSCLSLAGGALSSVQDEPGRKRRKANRPVRTSCPQFQRRCTHCQVQRTPQWRAGPLGPKTLCNACGVRYKSGRLLPEYRPACSPTFAMEIHSNSHRKVLEMRRRKDMDGIGCGGEGGGGGGLAQVLRSC